MSPVDNVIVPDQRVKDLYSDEILTLCQHSFPDFVWYLSYSLTPDYPRPFPVGQIHREWCEAAVSHRYVQIVAPRDHAKSCLMTDYMIGWEIGNNPEERIKLVSITADKTKQRVKSIQDLLMTPFYQAVFPGVVPPRRGRSLPHSWTTTALTVNRSHLHPPDPTVDADGINSSVIGGRATKLVADDVVGPENIQTPSQIVAVKHKFFEGWMNCLMPGGACRYICTFWHKDDLSMQLAQSPHWHTIFYAVPDDCAPIWPEYYTKEDMEEIIATRGIMTFRRGYQNRPVTDDDLALPKDNWRNCEDQTWHLDEHIHADGSSLEIEEVHDRYKRIYTGVDLAIGSKLSEDPAYTVIFTIGVDSHGRIAPLQIKRGRMTAPEILDKIVSTYDLFHPHKIYIENNAMQGFVVQMAENVRAMPVEGFFTGSNKHSTETDCGLFGMFGQFENRIWRLPVWSHVSTCSCNWCAWRNEMLEFPVSRHDDTVMAAWLACEAFRAMSKRSQELRVISLQW